MLGKIYSILSDKDKRAVYDEDGTVDEEDSSVFRQDMNWTDFWGMLFRITTQVRPLVETPLLIEILLCRILKISAISSSILRRKLKS